ncbi:MAG: 2Fe-2S iron-sulfur cluster binding domain-containing protein [Salinibacterium sp.]|nr:2Fe-2S iron-sulfur cluster binding domain-containing protein [Salinibacterium sp.]
MNDPHIWWYVTRASAVIAWVLMTLSVVWGILLSTRIFRHSDNPGWLQDLHKYLGGASLVMVGLHMVSLMLDGWLSFTLPEVLVPFATDYRALPVALGILSFYVLLTVQLTSLFIAKLPRKAWKGIHYASYATLVLVAFHAGLSGTDVGQSWYGMVSIALVMVALVAVLVRMLASRKRETPQPVASMPAGGSRAARAVGPAHNITDVGAAAASLVGLLTRTEIPQLERQTMVVAEMSATAAGVLGIRLLPLGGATLPAWRPGAHVTLHLPNGLERQYSLCGDPADRGHFDIAVLRVDNSGGGSSYIHDQLRPGMTLEVDGPLNHFELEAANDYLFIAGGIGITPIKAMIESLPERRMWRLVYLGRSRTTMAFLPELLSRYPDRVTVLADDERQQRPDLSQLARSTADVYCCGPESLMAGVAQFVPPERLHFERFIPIVRAPQVRSHELDVTCARSGVVLQVGADENLLEALEERGMPVSGSCRKGVCGTCEVRVLDGIPDHLDSVLSDHDKDELGVMYPCVSRAVSRTIVLDI